MICTLPTHIFPIQADHDDEWTTAAAGAGGSFVCGQHPMSSHTRDSVRRSRQVRRSCPVNSGVRIVKVDPRLSTEFDQDPHHQTIAINVKC